MDLGTGLTLFGSAKLMEKFLGPTLEYFGEGIKDFSKKRVENLKKIFNNAIKKSNDEIDNQYSIPPRVLQGIIQEGSMVEDFIAIEYFGGVLASSRSGISRDDRGKYFTSLLSRLSIYQIRAHYIIYHIFKKVYNGKKIKTVKDLGDNKLDNWIFISAESFIHAMDFQDSEIEESFNIATHILSGLQRENLIEGFQAGMIGNNLGRHFDGARGQGIICGFSISGIELFLWAYGKRKIPIDEFWLRKNIFKIDKSVKLKRDYGPAF